MKRKKRKCQMKVVKTRVYNVNYPQYDRSRQCGGNVRIRNGN